MRATGKYAASMKMLQIRNVPDDVHGRLKARAALEGTSLSEYALAELRHALERPTRQELVERVRTRSAVQVEEPTEAAVRAERERR